MVESREVEMVWRCKRKGMQTGRLEKADVQSVFEFLLRLISRIRFILLGSARALVCCRKCIPISVVCTRCTFPKHLPAVRMLFVHMCFNFPYFSVTLQWIIMHFCIFSLASSLLLLQLFSKLINSLLPLRKAVTHQLPLIIFLTQWRSLLSSFVFRSQKTTGHLYKGLALGRI